MVGRLAQIGKKKCGKNIYTILQKKSSSAAYYGNCSIAVQLVKRPRQFPRCHTEFQTQSRPNKRFVHPSS